MTLPHDAGDLGERPGPPDHASSQADPTVVTATALQNAIFNSANFSSIATDAKGVIQIFNVGAERMLGYTAAEVMNRITPADISDAQEVIARATALSLELGTPITPGFEALVFKASRGIEDIYELTYIRKDQSRLPAVVSVTALRDAQGTIIGYLLIGTDNTARKQIEAERMQAEDELQRVNAKLAAWAQALDSFAIVAETDTQGHITYANDPFCEISKYARHELLGRDHRDVANSGHHPTEFWEEMWRTIGQGRIWRGEIKNRAKDGNVYWVDTVIVPMFGAHGKLETYLAIRFVITERKIAEELHRTYEQTLQRKNVELEAASRMKSAFLANMSHELRTPLNAIIGFSEVLHDGLLGSITAQQRGYVGDIFTSGKHLLSLINDILDLSKVEAGKMVLDLDPVDLSALLTNALSIIREKALVRRIRLRMDIAEDVGIIQADARKVKQIVYNLLSNAVKFTSEGGEVTIRATRVSRDDVSQLSGSGVGRRFPTSGANFREFLKLSVTDTGIGISPEGLEQLFEPFTQIDSGLARRFEGSGLGLALVKLLAELHGGAVAVNSAVGTGSCFVVWLPLRPVNDAPVAKMGIPVFTPEALLPGVPIALVVEDDLPSAELIRVQLEGEGFTVVHAVTAGDAMNLAKAHQLSLITLDIMLSGIDGWELLAQLKQHPDMQRVPVVIVSIVADRSRGFALGAAAVMQKPISRRELSETLLALGLSHTRPVRSEAPDDT